MSFDDIKRNNIEYLEETASQDPDRVAEEKALVRKIDLYLLPTIWLMYLLSYMDVSGISLDTANCTLAYSNSGRTLEMPKLQA